MIFFFPRPVSDEFRNRSILVAIMIKCGNIKGIVYNHVYSKSYIRYLTRKKSLARFKWLIFSFLHFCCIGESKKHSKMYISIDNVCGNVLLLSSLLSSYIKQPSAQIGWTDDGPSFIEFHRSTGGVTSQVFGHLADWASLFFLLSVGGVYV